MLILETTPVFGSFYGQLLVLIWNGLEILDHHTSAKYSPRTILIQPTTSSISRKSTTGSTLMNLEDNDYRVRSAIQLDSNRGHWQQASSWPPHLKQKVIAADFNKSCYRSRLTDKHLSSVLKYQTWRSTLMILQREVTVSTVPIRLNNIGGRCFSSCQS